MNEPTSQELQQLVATYETLMLQTRNGVQNLATYLPEVLDTRELLCINTILSVKIRALITFLLKELNVKEVDLQKYINKELSLEIAGLKKDIASCGKLSKPDAIVLD